jgi:hypothetical protein
MKTLQEDESVQKMGVVRLSYLLNYNPTPPTKKFMDVSMGRDLACMYQSLPLRFAAIYVVSQPRIWDAAINTYLKVLSTALLVRTRLLTGKPPNPRHTLCRIAFVRSHWSVLFYYC